MALILKLTPDTDEYVLWSTSTGAPVTEVLTRVGICAELERLHPHMLHEPRLVRADTTGTSARWSREDNTTVDPTEPAFTALGSFTSDGLPVEIPGLDTQRWLPRTNLAAYCHAFDALDVTDDSGAAIEQFQSLTTEMPNK